MTFEGKLFQKLSTGEGRGSLWRDLGGSMWVKELENPKVWGILKQLANEYQNASAVLTRRDEFDQKVHRLMIH